MPQRTSYDTAVKHLFRLRCEAVLPQDLRRAIPASNRHRWRNEPPGKYAGAELNDLARRELQTLRAFAQHRQAQRVFRAYCRLILVFQQIVLKLPPLRSALRDNATTILDTFERCHPQSP